MKTSRHQEVARRKRRIERRLRPRTWTAQARPMYRASKVQYEHSDRVRGLASGGIGAMRRLAQHTGLVDAINERVEVLKVHLPYHESDHVLCRRCGVRLVRGPIHTHDGDGWTAVSGDADVPQHRRKHMVDKRRVRLDGGGT